MKKPLQKHTLNLREGDWDYLESIFKPNGIDVSFVIRSLVSKLVDTKRAEEAASNPTNTHVTSLDIDL